VLDLRLAQTLADDLSRKIRTRDATSSIL